MQVQLGSLTIHPVLQIQTSIISLLQRARLSVTTVLMIVNASVPALPLPLLSSRRTPVLTAVRQSAADCGVSIVRLLSALRWQVERTHIALM